MKLSHEYNEYVIGYVVTDSETNRSVNFQFDHNRSISYSPFDQAHFLNWGCEGDDTHEAFNEAELEEISEYLSNQTDAKKAEELVTTIFENQEIVEQMQNMLAETSELSYFDLEELAQKTSWVYAIINNGDLGESFLTQEDAQSEIDQLDDEDAHLCKIVHMSNDEYNAIAIIEEFAVNTYSKEEILKAFYSAMHSHIKSFVTAQLVQLNDKSNPVDSNYFAYLISNTYSVANYSLSQDPDGEAFLGEVNVKGFKEYAVEYINNLIYSVFEKNVNITDLLKNQ